MISTEKDLQFVGYNETDLISGLNTRNRQQCFTKILIQLLFASIVWN